MPYTNVTDKIYKDTDIKIYECNDGSYAVDINNPCGEFIYGFDFLGSFNCAMMKAVSFIDLMPAREY